MSRTLRTRLTLIKLSVASDMTAVQEKQRESHDKGTCMIEARTAGEFVFTFCRPTK